MSSAQKSMSHEVSDEIVAGNSACVKLFLKNFCCKFYERLFVVWTKKPKGAESAWEED